MIDLEKEFRTLRLLASALMIIGAGLILGGFGVALLIKDAPGHDRKLSHRAPVVEAPQVDTPSSETTAASASGSSSASSDPKPTAEEYKEKFSNRTSEMGVPTGMLGLLFLVLGWTLRWIIRNNIDDGDDPKDNQELFKAYAQQLVIAERQRAKNRKRLH